MVRYNKDDDFHVLLDKQASERGLEASLRR